MKPGAKAGEIIKLFAKSSPERKAYEAGQASRKS